MTRVQMVIVGLVTPCCITCLWVGGALAQPCGTFITKWGSSGSGSGQFVAPWGVAVDGSGDVYVADSANSRVQKFDSNGTFLTEWGSRCVLHTTDFCVDPDGPGPLELGDGQFMSTSGVAVGGGGDVYVADNNHRIQRFDSTGTFLGKWGSRGSGDGEFNQPHGIAVDVIGNVYVADSSNHRIQKFDSAGNFLMAWGSLGSGDGQFATPNDVAVDAAGNVYVPEMSNRRVQKFDSSGTFITKWGSQGSGDGEFDQPHSITVDANGNVFVVDKANQRIQKFDSNGTFITKWGSFCVIDTPDFWCVDPDGPGPLELGDGQFFDPRGVAVDGTGNVYVTEQFNNRVQKFACPPPCGDGILDPDEQCDDGGESATCDADCTWALCGDGTLNVTAGEQCDDGAANGTLESCCSATCVFEPPLTACDDGNPCTVNTCDGAGTCVDLGCAVGLPCGIVCVEPLTCQLDGSTCVCGGP